MAPQRTQSAREYLHLIGEICLHEIAMGLRVVCLGRWRSGSARSLGVGWNAVCGFVGYGGVSHHQTYRVAPTAQAP